MTSACNVHYATSSWLNPQPRNDSPGLPASRGMKAAIAGSITTGLAAWPVIISTLIGGPIGLLISGGISLAVIGTTSAVTYAATENDPGA